MRTESSLGQYLEVECEEELGKEDKKCGQLGSRRAQKRDVPLKARENS